MTTVPPLLPVTIPDKGSTEATPMLPEDQTPPPASESVVLAATQTVAEPEIAEGSGLTVAVA